MRRLFVPIVTVAVLVSGLAACSSSSKSTSSPTTAASSSPSSTTASSQPASNPAVVIGSANFPENEILADIYADVLKGKGVPVTTKLDIGSREVYFKEMENGTLNLFPEYNGALLDYLQPTATASTTDAVDAALAQALPSSLEALQSSSAQDKDSVTVTSSFAKAHNLSSISDLKALGTITFGGPPEWKTREQGLIGLEKVYGLSINFKPLDESGPLTIAALNGGTVQAGDIFTTDPSVTKYHFVALSDPKQLFSAQNVTPIIAKSVATPTITNALNAVSAALTTATLVQLVGAVVNDHIDASTVAAQFVQQANLG
ncbi:MAG TPA: ABC transporter substrate-binding protein [Acidimicrobiales bacterium]|nr:ABC transporter substrate-binding protein [Acidimicrobiales bacterium]